MANTETVHVDVRPHIAAVAKPGDTVLIGFEGSLCEDDIDAIDASFRPFIDAGIQIGFLDKVTGMVVLRPGIDPANRVRETLEGCEEPGER